MLYSCQYLERERKDLFKGLWIEGSDWKWEEYPVIRIDLNIGDFNNNGIDSLYEILRFSLKESADIYNVALEGEDIAVVFKSLIAALHHKYNKKVAVIIDEYDKPLLSTIDNDALHSTIKNVLKNFYGLLKSADEHLAFLFITGVTKFS